MAQEARIAVGEGKEVREWGVWFRGFKLGGVFKGT